VIRRRTCFGAALLASLCALLPLCRAATPAQYRQHVGIYIWGQLASDLARATEDAKRLGADQVARTFIGPRSGWDSAAKYDGIPLDVKARSAEYHQFFAAFPVEMLTAYDAASYEQYKQTRLASAQLARTADEFRRFTLELAKTPGRKIVSNWEFENDCPPKNWQGCEEYYQARLDGIAQGKREAKALGYPGEILTAFEFTIVPGFAGRPSGLVEVGARLKGVDFLSYSAWWSIRSSGDAATVRKDFEYLANMLRNFAASKRITTRLIIGEFGEYWNQFPTADRLKAIMDASIDSGVDYLFNWVLYDQPGRKDEWGRDASHFGKYLLDGTLTPQGKAFKRWFAPAHQEVPATKKAGRSP
jgi:hypothetical protein